MKHQTDTLNLNRPLRLFLIGMPGVGKSHWGRVVSAHFRLPFFDLDEYIVENEGMTIAQIFATYGEDGFRKREQAWLQQLLANSSPQAIIACGGGTPCFFDNMAFMKQHGVVVYLQAEVPELMVNLKKSTEIRPLFGKEPIYDTLNVILAKRKGFYEQADHILQAKDISISNFEKILSNV
jgi:shikimate kinase